MMKGGGGHGRRSPLLEAIFLPFIEQVRLRATQIDYFRTTVSIFFRYSALLAIVGIGDSLASTNHASTLVGPVIALITHSDESAWSDIGIAYDTFAIAFLAEPANGNARLLSAHNEVWMMLCHDCTKQTHSKNSR